MGIEMHIKIRGIIKRLLPQWLFFRATVKNPNNNTKYESDVENAAPYKPYFGIKK